jgi:outer membrane protein assembly factor BamE (lipoprotein component of BamABCDE complex)
VATFGGDVWYYISTTLNRTRSLRHGPLTGNIVAVEFAKDGKVTDVHKYTLADGRIVDYVSRETPTRGRELSLIQQIFNAVPGQIGQTAPGEATPGGGQAPPIPGPR